MKYSQLISFNPIEDVIQLVTALFFDNKSEHQVSRETGVPQRTIHDRKIKILAKLKRLMNE